MTINDTLQHAISCHQSGQLQEAEKLYRSILQSQPDQPDANHNLGLLAMQVGLPAAGLPYLQHAWKMHPDRVKFCQTLTECLLHLDRAHDALQVIKTAPPQKGLIARRAFWLLQLASSLAEGIRPALSVDREIATLIKAGNHAALEQRVLSLLNQYPEWGDGWSALCTSLQIQGKDCEHALQQALQFMPDDTGAHAHAQRKVFCIGANKTGTKSMYAAFRSLGLAIGNQGHAEMLIHDWSRQDYRRLIRYCQAADAFQDVPFSLDGTFQAMDEAFPGSKFILTVRNDAEEWYESLVRFLTQWINKGRTPTADDLRQFDHCYPGYIALILGTYIGGDGSALFDRKPYTRWYEEHNRKIKTYFRDRPDDLLVLNVAEPDAMKRLLEFLGYPYSGQQMPHFNSSRDHVAESS